MPYAVAILVLLLCAAAPVSATDCAADQVNRVAGGNECLVMRAFGEPAERTTLVIFLHGDGSRGGPSDYMYADAGRMAAKGIVTVALIRPGYYDSANNHSTGYSYREDGDGYQPHVIEAVATAVTRLKEYYRADRVILAGHSGGSAIAGVIIGQYPDLAQAAVLGACPCNVPEWREMRRGHNSWHASLSPHDYVDDVATTMTVIAVTGTCRVIAAEIAFRDRREKRVIKADVFRQRRRLVASNFGHFFHLVQKPLIQSVSTREPWHRRPAPRHSIDRRH